MKKGKYYRGFVGVFNVLFIIGKPLEYNFHIDLKWENYQYFKQAMEIVKRNVPELRILGMYKEGQKDFN